MASLHSHSGHLKHVLNQKSQRVLPSFSMNTNPSTLSVTLQPAGGQTSYRAKKPEEVDAEAWAHVASEGGDTSNATLVLSRWNVQFGRYQGKTFHWLLENDVGYGVNLVASHQKEQERTGSQSALMDNKVEYLSLIHLIQLISVSALKVLTSLC